MTDTQELRGNIMNDDELDSGLQQEPIENTAALPQTHYPLSFDANGGEYFRIWIVNIALTILTLGIYSAWATVRTRRYFYGKTSLDGTPFQFTAKPIPILIGRIIALVIFLIYGALGSINPTWAIGYLVLVILPLSPWIIMKSLQFRARYTVWRNIPFRFTGGYWSAAYAYVFLPITMPLTLSFSLPWYWKAKANYQFGNIQYGKLHSRFDKEGKGFWSTYGWAALGVLALLGGSFILTLLFGGISAIIASTMEGDFDADSNAQSFLMIFLPILLGLAFYLPAFCLAFFVQGRLFNASLGNMIFGTPLRPLNMKPTLPIGGFIWIRLSNVFLTLITLGFFWPWAKVREARYKLEHLAIATSKPLDVEASEAADDVGAAGAELASDFGFDISLF